MEAQAPDLIAVLDVAFRNWPITRAPGTCRMGKTPRMAGQPLDGGWRGKVTESMGLHALKGAEDDRPLPGWPS